MKGILNKGKDDTSNLEFENVDLTGPLKMTHSGLQFKRMLRGALDNRLKGKAVRQDPVNEDDLEVK